MPELIHACAAEVENPFRVARNIVPPLLEQRFGGPSTFFSSRVIRRARERVNVLGRMRVCAIASLVTSAFSEELAGLGFEVGVFDVGEAAGIAFSAASYLELPTRSEPVSLGTWQH